MRAEPRFGERLGFERARGCALGRTAALLLLPACGFIGFEGRSSDAGSQVVGDPMDAEVGEMDSGSTPEPEADASSVRDAEAVPSDTGVPDTGALADAEPDAFVDLDPPATQVTDYCTSLPKLQRQPIIDGVVDSQLNVVQLAPVGWSTSSAGFPLPDHTTATFALAWLPEGLYAYVRVVDPNRLPPLETAYTWQGDGVEIYFDSDGAFPLVPKYDNPGTVQIIVPAPVNGSTPSTRNMRFRDGSTLTAWTSTHFATFPTADGYVFEGLLQADAADVESLVLEAGHAVGIDLSINVSATDEQLAVDPDAGRVNLDGLRLGQYFLRTIASSDCGGMPFCNSGAFCAPTLVE